MSEELTTFERVARTKPEVAVRYMAYLAGKLVGDGDNLKNEIYHARAMADIAALSETQARDQLLRERFMSVARPFFDEHGVLGPYATDGQARNIIDLLYDERSRSPDNTHLIGLA